MKFMGNEQKHTQFKKQLEKEALEKITFWVILGCLLFCVPVFGLNFFNLQFSADEHLDFLNRAFDITYGKAAAY
ncbi:MAG: two-component sensor histidine kinase, partial [Angelakisella sp.]